MDPLASPSHVIVHPDWARKPMPNEIGEFYPKVAMEHGLAGAADISCRVTGDGSLQQCRVVSETPQGAGFGAAGLSMAPLFRMKPMTIDGQAVEGGTVRIPLKFVMPPEEQHPVSDTTSFAAVLAIAAVIVGMCFWLYRLLRRGFGVAPSGVGVAGAFRGWGSLAASTGAFAGRFEPEGEAYIFRSNLGSPGYRFDAAERDRLVAQFVRALTWISWGGGLLFVGLIAGLFAILSTAERETLDAAVLGFALGFLVVYVAAFYWLWNAPVRELRSRSPVTEGRSPAEARRLGLERLSWSNLGGGVLMVGYMLWRASRHADLLTGWNRLWVVGAAAGLVLIAVQAYRKWRSDAR